MLKPDRALHKLCLCLHEPKHLIYMKTHLGCYKEYFNRVLNMSFEEFMKNFKAQFFQV